MTKDTDKKKKFSCRLKILRIAPQFFQSLLIEGTAVRFSVLKNGLPADAEFGGAGYDPATHSFWFHVRSESFPEVPEGEKIPVLEYPMVQVVTDGKIQNEKRKNEPVTFHRAQAVLTKR